MSAQKARCLHVLMLLVAAAAPAEVFRHGRFEQNFTPQIEYANPLKDVDVQVEFTGPGGAREQVAAFWDGGRHWRVRFCP